jgi:hypothetical protein
MAVMIERSAARAFDGEPNVFRFSQFAVATAATYF